MSGRKPVAGILAVAALGLAAAGILLSSRKPRRTRGGGTLPYYQRTGLMSKVLLQLNTVPQGLNSIHVPDGFSVEAASAPGLVTYPMFISLDDRGRLFVSEPAGRNVSDQEMDRKAEM